MVILRIQTLSSVHRRMMLYGSSLRIYTGAFRPYSPTHTRLGSHASGTRLSGTYFSNISHKNHLKPAMLKKANHAISRSYSNLIRRFSTGTSDHEDSFLNSFNIEMEAQPSLSRALDGRKRKSRKEIHPWTKYRRGHLEAPGRLHHMQKLNDKVSAKAFYAELCEAGLADSRCHSIMLRFDTTAERLRRGLAHVYDMSTLQPHPAQQSQSSGKRILGSVKLNANLESVEANLQGRVPISKIFDSNYLTHKTDSQIESSVTNISSDAKGLIAPCVWTFNALIDQLVLEGDIDAAKRVVDEEMELHNVQPNSHTVSSLSLSHETLTRRRQQKLEDLVYRIEQQENFVFSNKCEGEMPKRASSKTVFDDSEVDDYDYADYDFDDFNVVDSDKVVGRDHPESFLQQVAEELFDAFCGNGVANIAMYTTMIRLCRTSSDAFRILHNIELSGMEPEPQTFHEVVALLMLEGDSSSALEIVNNDMNRFGLLPMQATLALFAKRNKSSYAKQRFRILDALLREGQPGEGPSNRAFEWFSTMQINYVANARMYNLMLMHTPRREDWLKLIGEMKGAGIKPTAQTMAVIGQLMRVSKVSVRKKSGGHKKA